MPVSICIRCKMIIDIYSNKKDRQMDGRTDINKRAMALRDMLTEGLRDSKSKSKIFSFE